MYIVIQIQYQSEDDISQIHLSFYKANWQLLHCTSKWSKCGVGTQTPAADTTFRSFSGVIVVAWVSESEINYFVSWSGSFLGDYALHYIWFIDWYRQTEQTVLRYATMLLRCYKWEENTPTQTFILSLQARENVKFIIHVKTQRTF